MSFGKQARNFLLAVPSAELYGMVAQFSSPGELLAAVRKLHEAGYRRFDTHSPFPIHGMERAMGCGRSRVPWLVLGGGLTGGLGGLLLQWWINVVDYPLIISGKPFFSVPAFIPVVFELTILLAAFGAVLGMLALNMLPMLYHPLFRKELFRRVTSDGFCLSVEARDPLFDPDRTRQLLESLGGQHVELVEP